MFLRILLGVICWPKTVIVRYFAKKRKESLFGFLRGLKGFYLPFNAGKHKFAKVIFKNYGKLLAA